MSIPPSPTTHHWILGNFDGVHHGHQALIRTALSTGARVGVVTFAPHPRAFFAPEAAPFLLTQPAQRTALLQQAGVHEVLTLPFNSALAAMPAQVFIDEVLKPLSPQRLYMGADFHFGHQRQGNAALLKATFGAESVITCPAGPAGPISTCCCWTSR